MNANAEQTVAACEVEEPQRSRMKPSVHARPWFKVWGNAGGRRIRMFYAEGCSVTEIVAFTGHNSAVVKGALHRHPKSVVNSRGTRAA